MLVISIGLLSAAMVGQSETAVDPESYAVYRALIPRESSARIAIAKRIVLKQQTVTNPDCFPKGRPLAEDWKPVLDDFNAQNSRPRTLEGGFDIGRDYAVVSSSEINNAFSSGGWREFYVRYPDSGGFIEVS